MMVLLKAILFSLLLFGCRSQVTTPPSCRLWCQAPCLYPWEQVRYYCCDTQVKTGNCPPLRPMCPEALAILPPIGSGYSPPPNCHNDQQCAGTDKCCFDQCLMHYTCKPADP